MFTNRVPLFKLFGFQVWIDWSWLILALLITWSLATGYFPSYHPDAQLSKTALWTMGAIGSVGLFVSIVLHELGHSLIARRFGMQMRGITLFIFGGVADEDNGPDSGSAYVFDLNCQSCPADLTGDGIVNTQDFLLFLGAWSISDPLADWNSDGIIDIKDFIAYLNDWVAGC